MQSKPLVLVNQNHATAEDVIALAQHVVSKVAEKFAVHLSHEVRFMGALEETWIGACMPAIDHVLRLAMLRILSDGHFHSGEHLGQQLECFSRRN